MIIQDREGLVSLITDEHPNDIQRYVILIYPDGEWVLDYPDTVSNGVFSYPVSSYIKEVKKLVFDEDITHEIATRKVISKIEEVATKYYKYLEVN